MTLDTVIMLFGAIVAALPFLQLPPNWIPPLSFIAGIVIIALGIIVRRRGERTPPPPPPSRSSQFVDAPQRMDDVR